MHLEILSGFLDCLLSSFAKNLIATPIAIFQYPLVSYYRLALGKCLRKSVICSKGIKDCSSSVSDSSLIFWIGAGVLFPLVSYLLIGTLRGEINNKFRFKFKRRCYENRFEENFTVNQILNSKQEITFYSCSPLVWFTCVRVNLAIDEPIVKKKKHYRFYYKT